MVPVIKKIVGRKGKVIWKYQPRPETVLSPRVSKLVTEVLSKVMQYGTGQRAKDGVKVEIKEEKSEIDIPVPTFGKTGTADDFTNAGFVGCIPGPDRHAGKMKAEKGYVIATYVGYDDNRRMEKGNLRIYGSNGALPIWVDTATAIVNNPAYRENLQVADLVFSPAGIEHLSSANLQAVAVSPLSGLPTAYKIKESEPPEPPALLADVTLRDNQLELRRRFEPLRGGAVR
jgi:membrane peptidoglycan carboxypeptidase